MESVAQTQMFDRCEGFIVLRPLQFFFLQLNQQLSLCDLKIIFFAENDSIFFRHRLHSRGRYWPGQVTISNKFYTKFLIIHDYDDGDDEKWMTTNVMRLTMNG